MGAVGGSRHPGKNGDEPGRVARLFRGCQSGDVQVLGTAGTVTTIAAIHLGLTKYNRSVVDGSWLDSKVLKNIIRRLVSASFEERAALGCIGHNRAELVVAGCGVLDAIFKRWPAENLRVADRGVREGLLLALMVKANT